jgi:hypothetical protein
MITHPTAARMRSALLAFTLVVVPAAASAQAAAALPDGKTLVGEYNKAIGGKDAYAKIQSLHMSGTFDMPAMGMGGTIDIYSARPNMNALTVSIGGFGEVQSGSNGTVAWAMDPQQGAHLLEGAELKAALEDASFEGQFRDPASFTTIETIEKTTLDGRVCYKVKLVRTSGRESFDCYGVDDKLLVATLDKRVTAGGDLESMSFAREYKEFNGVKLPTKLVVTAGGMEQVVTISKVEVNAVPASQFELPAAIKALIK